MRGLQRLVSCLLPSNAARTMALQRSPLFRCRLFLTPNALLSTCNAAQFPSSLSPLASPDVQHLLAELETNRALQEEFVLSLSDHARRSISIIGASAEDRSQANAAALDAVLDTADADDDGNISRREFGAWLITQQANATTDAENAHENVNRDSDEGNAGAGGAVPLPTNRQIMLLGAGVAIPMIGFGFMDNFIMILAGDAIDASIGTYFGLSMMASAALGNLVSDVMGIGLGDVVDTVAKKAGLPPPKLSKAQLATTRTKMLALFFSSLGIAIGCILGMVPLLFMETDWEREMRDAFEALDRDNDGVLHASDFILMFEELGVPNPAAAACAVVEHIGEDVQTITFKEYLAAMKHLKENTGHLEKGHKNAAVASVA